MLITASSCTLPRPGGCALRVPDLQVDLHRGAEDPVSGKARVVPPHGRMDREFRGPARPIVHVGRPASVAAEAIAGLA